MPFEMYGEVILTRDVPEQGLRAGDVGTVVERHTVPGVPEEGYSVELFDITGDTVAVATLPASALRLPTRADRPAVRALSASKPSDYLRRFRQPFTLPKILGLNCGRSG